MQDLRTAQMDSQKPMNQLASELAALKEQISAKELSWEHEKLKMMKALKSERERRKLAQAGKKPREMVEVISSLSHSPNQDSPAEEVQVKVHQQTLSRQLQDLTTAQVDSEKPDNQLASEIAALKEQISAKENVTALKTQEENCDKKVKQTVLDQESYTKRKDSELIRSEVEWKIKLTALEDRKRCELAAKEESFQRQQELQRQTREMEEWRNQKEEEINLLTQQSAALQVHNLRLQELAQQTDKKKVKFKKEEKKATKEAEKILKDRKEEEQREKNEKKEREKREKEELKRQKKENILMEKREKERM